MVGRYVSVSYGGLLFRYSDDFEWYLGIDDSLLPPDRSILKGLCGNANEDPADDFILKNGAKATSIAEFGNSFALTQVSGPVSESCHILTNRTISSANIFPLTVCEDDISSQSLTFNFLFSLP